MRKPPALEITEQAISTFFTEYIDGWLMSDLRYCAQQEKKNLSFTVATLALNAVDFFAGLYGGQKGTAALFRQFVVKYLPLYQTINDKIDLYDTYRCGLVHEYFPKYHHGIVWNRPEEHLKCCDGLWCINAQTLASDVEKAIATYRADLSRDANLKRNFKNRLEKVVGPIGVLRLFGGEGGKSDSSRVFTGIMPDLSEPPTTRD